MAGVATIIVQPLTAQLTTLAAARAMVDASTRDDDYNLSMMIDRASATIARYCGQPFGLRTISEVFHLSYFLSLQSVAPYGTPLTTDYAPLILSQSPIAGIVSVVENGVTLDVTGYEVDDGLIYRMRNGLRSWWATPTTTVVYEAGYTLPNDVVIYTLPFEVEDVCLSMVQSAFYNRASNPTVTYELTEGVGRVQYAKTGGSGTMPIDVGLQMVLEPHKTRVW